MHSNSTARTDNDNQNDARLLRRRALAILLFFSVVTAAGLAYVKWWPYFIKATNAIHNHTLGSSILGSGAGEGGASVWQEAWRYSLTYFNAVWKAALLGMIVSSMVQAMLPADWLKRALGGMNVKSTLIGGAASLPGMMCSCCAAPIAAGMRRQRVSVGAALAFWIGNPMLNPATLVFMAAVLPWKFTVLRIVFGLLLTFGVSYAAGRFADPAKLDSLVRAQTEATGEPRPADSDPLWLRWPRSFAILFARMAPIYVAAVFLTGLLQQMLLPSWATEGAFAIALFAIVGTLFVIPTAAEIPIAQSFLAIDKGIASTLLIALPAVSLPSLLLVSRSFPRKALVFVAVSVVLLGMASGYIGRLWL